MAVRACFRLFFGFYFESNLSTTAEVRAVGKKLCLVGGKFPGDVAFPDFA